MLKAVVLAAALTAPQSSCPNVSPGARRVPTPDAAVEAAKAYRVDGAKPRSGNGPYRVTYSDGVWSVADAGSERPVIRVCAANGNVLAADPGR